MATILIEQDGQIRKTSATFFRGKTTNFYPTDRSLDTDRAVARYMTHGWMPKEAFVDKATPLVAFGSCFASNISNYLHKRGYNVLTKREGRSYVTSMGDGIVNTFAILQQFKWAWLNYVPEGTFWHGYEAEEFGYDEEIRLETKALFDEADVFVITLGLSEIWYDEPTGEVFWRAVPQDRYDAERHKFRISTVEENKRNLLEIHSLIRRFRPDAKIVITVSPIPLTATFRPETCIAANAVSKAVLRVAVDEVMREVQPTDSNIYYFPSYDVVMYAFDNQWTEDRRHVYPHVLDFNMKVFETHFCQSKMDASALEKAYKRALELDRKVARGGHEAVSHPQGLTPIDAIKKTAARKLTKDERLADRVAKRVAERIAARRRTKLAAIENE
ncbi:GSCFA domain-containing protein [Polaromonas sp. JS666]|uniref:GSCFA domain-containing protein n=1 Tax=Polaromonas sp. (strain JS666 / ATCC BAA-500) TaxID=296591 RepID=UPI0000538758|nr:GSCFA domain-containing protein [Polaromonas sp. JS666]ABE46809.1 hypothetical protein Bpro_4935 [Polaromonas sp. JS666]